MKNYETPEMVIFRTCFSDNEEKEEEEEGKFDQAVYEKLV